ncbi:hypothetical protein PMZ80_005363 [Knufia obscura]|uniref:Beta-xylosidase C-terminal Concanavalin A-like domain-containing protein n=1 Tax=Knufia obscura TaxID=1635080 RepID=A0ABR0RQ88_9EURO|nr:hypothetical protein PMZ80_005363 [Knufia obscura]
MFHQQALRRLSRSAADETSLETFRNPILPGFNPDPSIIRVKKDYFLTTSSFEYTPGAPIYHSTDLIQWTLIGHALTRKSQLDIKAPEPGGGVWACTLRYHDGWFYLTTCVWDRYRPQDSYERAWPQGFYVKTKDIWNSDSWSDPVYFDQPGFDQDLFWDDDGKVYLSTTHRKVDRDPDSKLKDQGVHICTIGLETGDSASQSTLVRESRVGDGVAEGSHIFKKGKYYYLFTAEGGTESGHSEFCFRSEKSPLGPWEACPHNPLVHNNTNDEVQNTGHCDFVEDVEGHWWAVCLAVRPLKTETGWTPSVFGRESFLVPVSWSDDEWPELNHGRPIALQTVAPARGIYMYDQPTKWSETFNSPKLQLGWYRKNTAVKPDSDCTLTARPGYLRLYGGPFRLNKPNSPTALFRKQLHRQGVWRAKLSFEPGSTNCEAGTAVYMDYFTWSSIGVRRASSGVRQVVLTLAEGEVVSADLKTDDAEIVLAIECQESMYRFGFEEAVKTDKNSTEGGFQWLGETSTETMTRYPPVGLPFTGMMFCLYSFGEMQRSPTPADFAFAEFM